MSLATQQQIQILHVDDEPDFADLTGTFLEREDDRFTVETATSADDGLETISDRPPDCVVSDYNMPGTDGLEFLQAVREDNPDLPFILYTGKGSEAVASEAIAADVTNYLQKGSGSEQYELLANRIRNAVNQHRSEQRLRQTQREYAAVFENAQNGLLLVDVEADGFRYQQCNPRAVELIGRDKTEIVGKSPYDALGPENGKKVVDAYHTCTEQGTPVEYTVTLDLPMGQVIRECEATPVAANGEVEQLVVAFQDITDQHERQQELRRNKRAMDEAPVGITITDPGQEDNPIIYANNGFRNLTGYADDEILGHNCRFLQGEDTSPGSVATLREAIDNEERVTAHLRNYRKDGTEFWNRVSIAPVRDDEGSVVNFVGFQQNITDHKQRELELERARDLLDQTERLADVGGWEIDTETMEVHWTENLFDLLGMDYDEEPPLEEALEIYHEDDRPLVENAVETALDAGEPFDVEARFHRPDGDLRWLRVQGTPKTDDGRVVTLRGTVQDITEQKQMERDLRQERNLVTGIVETSPVGIAVVTADGEFSFANDRAKSIYRRPLEEIKAMSHDDPEWDLVNEHGDSLEAGEAPFDRVVSRETTIRDLVVGIRRPSGERVWLSVSGSPQYNENGELKRAVFAFEDITERRELEAEFKEMLGRVSDAFFALDDEFRFTHVNGRAEKLLQASEDELLGETLWEMYPEAAEFDRIWDAFHVAMDTQTPQSLELYYEPLDFWVEASVYPSESGISVYFRDVTDQKEYEQKLQTQNERLDEFASIVSHDLRNPLQVADGRLELIREECESEHIDDVAQALARMDALIEDVLTLAREGEQVDKVEPVGLANAARNGWQTVETEQAALETETSQAVEADRSRLQQLFENLYRNAVEHGGDGVTVSVGTMDDGFYVADTGSGIPEADREAVFEAGYSTSEDGTGFGLRIVEQIVDAHGWEITVTESDQGGTRFEVTGVAFADR